MNRVSAMISLLSESVPAEQMTVMLSFSPDSTVLKGLDRSPPRPTPARHGWYVSSSQANARGVDEVLSCLLGRLGELHAQLAKLRQIDPDLEVRFNIAVVPYCATFPLYFRPETVVAVSRFGGSLDIEFFPA
jgi:hypothetical protein